MAGHPQNSPRGLFAKRNVDVISSGGVVTRLSANSSGVTLDRGISVSSQGAHVITANSTGLRIGSRYISTNTTGNSAT
jgi:hypothetical protein